MAIVLTKSLAVLSPYEKSGSKILYDDNIAKISIVGVGMKSHTAVAAKMFKALAENSVNIHMISTSEIKISCVIDLDKLEVAANSIHKSFDLDKK